VSPAQLSRPQCGPYLQLIDFTSKFADGCTIEAIKRKETLAHFILLVFVALLMLRVNGRDILLNFASFRNEDDWSDRRHFLVFRDLLLRRRASRIGPMVALRHGSNGKLSIKYLTIAKVFGIDSRASSFPCSGNDQRVIDIVGLSASLSAVRAFQS
jgi:hypothetical protein